MYKNLCDLLFTFEGRISRRQFWVGTLLVSIALALSNAIAITMLPTEFFFFSSFVVSIFFSLSSICLGIKRLHDRNRSGWWFLLSAIPVFGTIWYILEAGFFESLHNNNRFGDAPLPTISAVL